MQRKAAWCGRLELHHRVVDFERCDGGRRNVVDIVHVRIPVRGIVDRKRNWREQRSVILRRRKFYPQIEMGCVCSSAEQVSTVCDLEDIICDEPRADVGESLLRKLHHRLRIPWMLGHAGFEGGETSVGSVEDRVVRSRGTREHSSDTTGEEKLGRGSRGK